MTASRRLRQAPGASRDPTPAAARAPGVIGLDLGTSGLKGVAVGGDGTCLAAARCAYPTHRTAPGRAEQDPTDWVAAARRVVATLRATWQGTPLAIGLTGMIPTLVPLDGSHRPVGPAITWEDGRAEAEGLALRAEVGGDRLYRITGQWVDGRYLAPMHSWLAAQEPARAARIRWLASARDHLFRWLTGVLATDPSTATGFGTYALATGGWDPELCAAAGVSAAGPVGGRPGLPELRPARWLAPLRPEAAGGLGLEAGLPVALGGADSVVGALGLGAAPGDIAHLAGSSTVILGLSGEPRFEPDHRWLVTPLAGQAGWGLEMDLLATGSALGWLGGLLGLPDSTGAGAVALAATAEAGAGGTVFLPHLGGGEQGALWDPDLRGVVGGLTLATGRAQLARALVDGILVETRRCTELLCAAGLADAPIHVGGWGADDPTVLQWVADATGRTVGAPAPGSVGGEALSGLASALGAARLAAAAIDRPLPPPARDGARRGPRPGAAAIWSALARRNGAWLRQTAGRALDPADPAEPG